MKQELEQKPAWLELPAGEVAEYWTTKGRVTPLLWWQWRKTYAQVFATKEEAEARSSERVARWGWNGEDAYRVPLRKTLSQARKDGRPGVQLTAYQNGQWITIKEWPAGVPLSGGEL